MSHTPGPYKVEDYGILEALDIVTVNGGAVIGSACVDTERGVDYVQMAANAALFSAAPDLLAAARALLSNPTTGSLVKTDARQAMTDLINAIAKAEGR